jgi:hypothetical protein
MAPAQTGRTRRSDAASRPACQPAAARLYLPKADLRIGPRAERRRQSQLQVQVLVQKPPDGWSGGQIRTLHGILFPPTIPSSVCNVSRASVNFVVFFVLFISRSLGGPAGQELARRLDAALL